MTLSFSRDAGDTLVMMSKQSRWIALCLGLSVGAALAHAPSELLAQSPGGLWNTPAVFQDPAATTLELPSPELPSPELPNPELPNPESPSADLETIAPQDVGESAPLVDDGGLKPDLSLDHRELYDPLPELTSDTWFDPWGWRESWDISFELGINGNQGNSDTLNLQSGLDLEQKRDEISRFIRFRYANTYAAGVETKNNAMLKLGHEREFGDSPWSWFARSDVIYDRFKAFDLRFVANSGVGYRFFETDVSSLKTRLGAGASREIGGPDNQWSPEGVLGLDFKRQLTKRQLLTAIIDYYPEMTRIADYRVVTDVSWSCELDEEANLSLKLSVLDEYDSTPHGRRPNDLNYAFLLMWKF